MVLTAFSIFSARLRKQKTYRRTGFFVSVFMSGMDDAYFLLPLRYIKEV
jgi:hypothetical protein